MSRKKRVKRIKRMNINEVSWVDNPANEIPFLFVKNADGNKELEKMDEDTNLDMSISVKEGELSSLSVNGEEVEGEVTSVNLSYWGDYLCCSYEVKGETDEGGFDSMQRYSMEKGVAEKIDEYKAAAPATEDELAKVRRLAEVPDTADGQIVRELGEYAETIAIYADELPADLRKAISETIRLACNTQEVDVDTEDSTMQKEAETNQDTPAENTASQEGNASTETNAASQGTQQASQQVAPSVVLTEADQDAIAAKVVAQLAAKQEADKAAAEMVEMSDEEVAQMIANETAAAIAEGA